MIPSVFWNALDYNYDDIIARKKFQCEFVMKVEDEEILKEILRECRTRFIALTADDSFKTDHRVMTDIQNVNEVAETVDAILRKNTELDARVEELVDKLAPHYKERFQKKSQTPMDPDEIVKALGELYARLWREEVQKPGQENVTVEEVARMFWEKRGVPIVQLAVKKEMEEEVQLVKKEVEEDPTSKNVWVDSPGGSKAELFSSAELEEKKIKLEAMKKELEELDTLVDEEEKKESEFEEEPYQPYDPWKEERERRIKKENEEEPPSMNSKFQLIDETFKLHRKQKDFPPGKWAKKSSKKPDSPPVAHDGCCTCHECYPGKPLQGYGDWSEILHPK